jgi:YebC/PmpR family DNA-binding regulatory protein
MAGHSKFHNIKHKKGAADAIRGKIFTKHAKLIAIASKTGADPDINSNLKNAINNAKADNVPNDNIKRAIAKGSGEGSNAIQYQEVAYEGYAPGGIAIIIEAITDNTNRTYTNIRTIVEKNGGNLGSKGAVSWMFQDIGSIELIIKNNSQETIEEDLIESGAEDFCINDDNDLFFIQTKFENLNKVKEFLTLKGYQLQNIKKDKIADTQVALSDTDTERKFLNLFEKLQEDDDVSEIYHNATDL